MTFDNAHHFGIGNATIIHNSHPLPTRPDEILRLAQAGDASHRSNTATYAPKCHPETRKQVIEDIVDWVVGNAGAKEDPSPHKSILWFSGPAGAGKTCVMRSIAERCETRGLSVISYFFSMRKAGLTTERPFVATAVHQLTLSYPDLRIAILNIIRGYPTIFDESLDFQMEKLLVQPLQPPAPLLPPSHKVVIVVDGLDECSEEDEREHLINFLHTLVTKLPHLIVVVIASRPEFDLRQIFDKPKLSKVTKVIQLQEYDGSKDVRVFLRDEFEGIRQSHPLKRFIPEGWPLKTTVQLLVEKSSGNFILPSMATRYIKKSQQNPVDSLNIIVGLLEGPSPDTSEPFAELDALYSHILHRPNTDIDRVKRILHCLLSIAAVAEGRDPFYRSPTFLDDFLGFSPSTTTVTLCNLHSILSIPDSENAPIGFHHMSLEGYLLDAERSKTLFRSRYDAHLDLTTVCAMRLTRWGANPVVDRSHSLRYAFAFWEDHLRHCISFKPSSVTLPDIILNMDIRVVIKCGFVHGYSLSHSTYAKLYSTKRRVRLGQLLPFAANSGEQGEASSEPLGLYGNKGKLQVLPRAPPEPGLYPPLDLGSRMVSGGEGGMARLQNPPTPDPPQDLSSPSLLRKPSTPDHQRPPKSHLRRPPTPDPQRPPTPENLSQNPPAPGPSCLRSLGRRIRHWFCGCC